MIQVRQNGGVVIEMNPTAVAGLARQGGPMDVYTKGKTSLVLTKARQFSPVRSGKNRASLRMEQSRESTGRYKTGYSVSANMPYSAFISKPTPPHEILPKSAKVLAFQVGGTTVFARRVMHPGTKGNNYLERALYAVAGGIR